MIIKTSPKQTADLWDFIKHGILSAPSPIMEATPESLHNIFANLLTEKLQCWLVYENVKDKKEIYGFVLTTVAEDYVSSSRFLNIYDLYSFKQFTEEMWEEGFKALEAFAKANLCHVITAYSNIPLVIELSEKFGFDASCRFLLKEVK